ncbi:hypothetical protein QLX08_006738 [Tetragonisca angustula]|uniref:Uncharacterized protein n=1 Tax=Tetragonisca angustula TaxID=166442 RepID=A0AAW0ZSB3_9HYME
MARQNVADYLEPHALPPIEAEMCNRTDEEKEMKNHDVAFNNLWDLLHFIDFSKLRQKRKLFYTRRSTANRRLTQSNLFIVRHLLKEKFRRNLTPIEDYGRMD